MPSTTTLLSSVTLLGREVGRVGVDRLRPGRAALPADGAAIEPRLLERVAGLPHGTVRSLAVLDEHHGTAGCVRLRVEVADGGALPATLFVKLTPRNVVQQLMMNLFDLGRRETLFYSSLAPGVPVRVPRCYGVELDARSGRNLMVLEDLDGSARFRDIREPVDLDEAGAVLDALADLHAACWCSPRLTGELAGLQARRPAAERLGNAFVGRILGSLRGVAAEAIPAELQEQSRIVHRRRAEVDALWASLPRTVCHGDTHLGNLFFEQAGPGFLDWQAVMIAPGMRDVSYFLISSLDGDELERHERRLVQRYVERLADGGVVLDPEEAWTLYRATAVEIFVAAVVTASTSDRMQAPEISRVGVERVARATGRLDTFTTLLELLDRRR